VQINIIARSKENNMLLSLLTRQSSGETF